MQLLMLGAGGHARVIIDMLHKRKDFNIEEILLLDDGIKKGTVVCGIKSMEPIMGWGVIGGLSLANNYKQGYKAIIAIGNNKIRQNIAEKYSLDYISLIHPNAVIANDVQIGAGTVVMAGAVINSGTIIGRHCIINSGATVDHDNIIHDFVHISPGAHLGGTVEIGAGSWIGIGSAIINNVTLTQEVTIGAGGVVIQSIRQKGTYVGIPAKNIKL